MVDRFLVWLGAEMVTAAVAAEERSPGPALRSPTVRWPQTPKGRPRPSRRNRLRTNRIRATVDASAPKPKPAGGEKPKEDASADPSGCRKKTRLWTKKSRPSERPDETPTTVKDPSDTAEKLADQTEEARRQGAEARGDADGQARAPRTKPSGIQGRQRRDRQAVGPPILPRTVRSPCAVPRCASTAPTGPRCPRIGKSRPAPKTTRRNGNGSSTFSTASWRLVRGKPHRGDLRGADQQHRDRSDDNVELLIVRHACWLGAPRMQQAVAYLFEEDNSPSLRARWRPATPCGVRRVLPITRGWGIRTLTSRS